MIQRQGVNVFLIRTTHVHVHVHIYRTGSQCSLFASSCAGIHSSVAGNQNA